MKLKITRSTVFDGRFVDVGEVVESKSRFLVNIGKAEIVPDDTPVKKPKRKLKNKKVDDESLETR